MSDPTKPMTTGRTNVQWLWLSAVVMALDQLSKWWVVRHMERFDSVAVLPNLNLVRLHNTGVAFSMFAQAPAAVFTLLGAVVATGIVIWLRRNPHGHRILAIAFTLILGGALGNAIDRVLRGHVVDFVDFHADGLGFSLFGFQPFHGGHFPAFNVADSAITVGAILLILDMLLESRRAARTKAGTMTAAQ